MSRGRSPVNDTPPRRGSGTGNALPGDVAGVSSRVMLTDARPPLGVALCVGVGILAGAVAAAGCSTAPATTHDAGIAGPYLTSLAVTSAVASELTLVPPFSATIHDYYVRCPSDVNALTVSMSASAGAVAAVAQPTTSPAQASQTLMVTVNADQAVVATATQGKTSVEYWVRCLPPAFPTMEMVAHPDAGAPTPGYYLVGNESPPHPGVGYVMIVDGNGVPVWYAAQPSTPPYTSNSGAFDVDTPGVGVISFITWPSANQASPFQLRDLAKGTTRDVAATGWALDPHELRFLPNGNFLMFTDQLQKGVDLTGFNVALSDGGVDAYGPNSAMFSCDILEVDPTGNVVWRWIASDHLDPVKDSEFPSLQGWSGGPLMPDPFHCNSIDVDTANGGNLLISARHMHSLFYIERSSGKILWKMGGSEYTKEGAPYVPVADPFFFQHDARLRPGWSLGCGGKGQISVFDDHLHAANVQTGTARGVIYDVNVGVGAGCGTPGASVAWQYDGARYSVLMGSFRIYPDGTRLIGWGLSGAGIPAFTEVDEAGHDLLDFTFTQATWSFRAVKVPLSQFDLGVMRNATGGM